MEGHCLKPMQVLWILPQSLLDKSYAYIFWFSFLLVFWGVGMFVCLFGVLCLFAFVFFVCLFSKDRETEHNFGWVGREVRGIWGECR